MCLRALRTQAASSTHRISIHTTQLTCCTCGQRNKLSFAAVVPSIPCDHFYCNSADARAAAASEALVYRSVHKYKGRWSINMDMQTILTLPDTAVVLVVPSVGCSCPVINATYVRVHNTSKNMITDCCHRSPLACRRRHGLHLDTHLAPQLELVTPVYLSLSV